MRLELGGKDLKRSFLPSNGHPREAGHLHCFLFVPSQYPRSARPPSGRAGTSSSGSRGEPSSGLSFTPLDITAGLGFFEAMQVPLRAGALQWLNMPQLPGFDERRKDQGIFLKRFGHFKSSQVTNHQ
jgi:hypothetical protein